MQPNSSHCCSSPFQRADLEDGKLVARESPGSESLPPPNFNELRRDTRDTRDVRMLDPAVGSLVQRTKSETENCGAIGNSESPFPPLVFLKESRSGTTLVPLRAGSRPNFHVFHAIARMCTYPVELRARSVPIGTTPVGLGDV